MNEPTGLTRLAVAGMFLSFVVIGALQAMYGPANPAMRDRFDLTASAVGVVISVHFVGALLGVLGTPLMRRRMSNRAFLTLALATIAAGSLLFAAAPGWGVALAAAFAAGVGFGWIDVGVNELFIEFYGTGSTGLLNVLHANFGVGAVLGPLLIGALPGRLYLWGFVVCAALALLVLATTAGVSGRGGTARTGDRAPWATVWPLAVLFMIFFVLHVGVESGVGGWETSHLVYIGWAAGPAAMVTSGFWLAMTAVRFGIPPLARRYSAEQILLASTAVMLAGTFLALWGPLAPFGYVVVGLGVGPLFPTGLVWLAQRLPGVHGMTSFVVAASMLGGLLPGAIGALADTWGLGVIPTALLILSAACLLVALVIKAYKPGVPAAPEPHPIGRKG